MAIYHIVPLCLITHEPQGASRPEHARCESPAGGASLLVLGPCQTGAASLATRKNLPSSSPPSHLPKPRTGVVLAKQSTWERLATPIPKRKGTISNKINQFVAYRATQKGLPSCSRLRYRSQVHFFATKGPFSGFRRLFGCFELLLPLLMSGPCYAQGIQGVVQRAGADAAGLS